MEIKQAMVEYDGGDRASEQGARPDRESISNQITKQTAEPSIGPHSLSTSATDPGTASGLAFDQAAETISNPIPSPVPDRHSPVCPQCGVYLMRRVFREEVWQCFGLSCHHRLTDTELAGVVNLKVVPF